MKVNSLLTVSALALSGWFAIASGGAFQSAALAGDQSLDGSQFAQNEQHQVQHETERDNQWYQGQRGHWRQTDHRWEWRGAQGDQWYQGHRGHWYQETNGWQFRKAKG